MTSKQSDKWARKQSYRLSRHFVFHIYLHFLEKSSLPRWEGREMMISMIFSPHQIITGSFFQKHSNNTFRPQSRKYIIQILNPRNNISPQIDSRKSNIMVGHFFTANFVLNTWVGIRFEGVSSCDWRPMKRRISGISKGFSNYQFNLLYTLTQMWMEECPTQLSFIDLFAKIRGLKAIHKPTNLFTLDWSATGAARIAFVISAYLNIITTTQSNTIRVSN